MSLVQHKDSKSFKILLYIAGTYHLLWGLSVVFFPAFFFRLSDMAFPNYMELWQVIGFYTTILGAGYLLASSSPIRHWRIVLLGFINKLIIILFFLNSVLHHTENSIVFKMIVLNHIIWLFPFSWILYNAYKMQYLLDNELIRMNHLSTNELLEMFVTNKEHTVVELAQKQPVMLIFLRHFGCTFCKETLYNIRKYKKNIEEEGTKIIVVNMLDEKTGLQELEKYNLSDIEYISDPESLLYKAFKLKRGTVSQLFGFKVWARGLYLWFTKGAFVTSPDGADVYQMPGIFLIYKGAVVKQFIHRSAADNPPYLELASCKSCIPVPSSN